MAVDKYTLKLPQIEDIVTVYEDWDFGGHRISIHCGDIYLYIYDDVLTTDAKFTDSEIYKQIKEKFINNCEGDIYEFIAKYEVKNG